MASFASPFPSPSAATAAAATATATATAAAAGSSPRPLLAARRTLNPLSSPSPRKPARPYELSNPDAGLRWRARVSFFPSFLRKKEGKSPDALKEELFEAIAPLDRGAEATPEDQERVDQIACELEAINSIKEPLKSDLLNGKWELIYTTSRSLLANQNTYKEEETSPSPTCTNEASFSEKEEESESYVEMVDTFTELSNEVSLDGEEFSLNMKNLSTSIDNLIIENKALISKIDLLKHENDALLTKFSSLTSSYENLNIEKSSLEIENKKLVSWNNDLQSQFVFLNKKIDDLTSTITKFTNGKNNFRKLLGCQKPTFKKRGLGYKSGISNALSKGYFEKANDSHDASHTCNYCGCHGHYAYFCHIRKMTYSYIPLRWIRKTNPQGPKLKWVPKFTPSIAGVPPDIK